MARTVLTGHGVGRGIGIAPSFFLDLNVQVPSDEPASSNPDHDHNVLREIFSRQALLLNEKATLATGDLAEVLTMSASILKDRSLLKDIRKRLERGEGMATAVDNSFREFAEKFSAMGGLMAERASDIDGLRNQVLSEILGSGTVSLPTEPYVLVARDLSVAETSQLQIEHVAGIVLVEAGPTGHTAIVAKQLGIPCMVQTAGVLEMESGRVVLVDPLKSHVIWEPTEQDCEQASHRARQEERLLNDVMPGATQDGHRVKLLANIAGVEDLAAGRGNPEGVGLFRTEMMFMNRDSAPKISDQVSGIWDVARSVPTGQIVVRTLDAGADKPISYINTTPEENPALGMRGNRLNRTVPQLLEDQLAAIAEVARTSPGSDIWAMAPMIATPDEPRDFARRARGFGINTCGVMIEIPAAAIQAEEILDHVDFVSIGTNDLSQYTMATDRLDTRLQDLLSPWQPAVLRLIKLVAEAGKRKGKPVGVCGESAADPLMALVLTGLGVTSLSMAPGSLSIVRHALRTHTLQQCRELAELAVTARNADEAYRKVYGTVSDSLKELVSSPAAA